MLGFPFPVHYTSLKNEGDFLNFCIYFFLVPRHHDDKNTERGVKSFSSGGVDRGDVYPVQLRLSILQETNSLAVKICKKVALNLQPLLVPQILASMQVQ